MFTGIIEATGIVKEVIINGSNKSFWIGSVISAELKIDQSVSHSGVCLTIEEISPVGHRVTAIKETLKKTDMGRWQAGTIVNLERCLRLDSRLDGHLVQGHVDTVTRCLKKQEKGGSWEYTFELPAKFGALLIEKGSISINGISLTAFNVTKKKFTVAVIPYTFEHTNIQAVQKNALVNIEFDLIGKYILRKLKMR